MPGKIIKGNYVLLTHNSTESTFLLQSERNRRTAKRGQTKARPKLIRENTIFCRPMSDILGIKYHNMSSFEPRHPCPCLVSCVLDRLSIVFTRCLCFVIFVYPTSLSFCYG